MRYGRPDRWLPAPGRPIVALTVSDDSVRTPVVRLQVADTPAGRLEVSLAAASAEFTDGEATLDLARLAGGWAQLTLTPARPGLARSYFVLTSTLPALDELADRPGGFRVEIVGGKASRSDRGAAAFTVRGGGVSQPVGDRLRFTGAPVAPASPQVTASV